MRLSALFAAVLFVGLSACAEPDVPATEPDVTGTVEAGGPAAGGSTYETPGVDSTGAGLDPDDPDAAPETDG